jgi:malate dehydrogenase (oxaloacetate-decarboxylating)
VPSARFVRWSDRVFDRHRGGKIEMHSRVAISTQQMLRDIYTPGVVRVCLPIRETPEKAFDYTSVGRAVAIVTDGSAILGLRQLREAARQTWMVVLASKFADTASRTVLELGADACLLKPFRFSDLLFRLESLAHHQRAA